MAIGLRALERLGSLGLILHLLLGFNGGLHLRLRHGIEHDLYGHHLGLGGHGVRLQGRRLLLHDSLFLLGGNCSLRLHILGASLAALVLLLGHLGQVSGGLGHGGDLTGNDSAHGNESILAGSVVNLDSVAIGINVAVRSGNLEGFVLGAGILYHALFLAEGLIAALVREVEGSIGLLVGLELQHRHNFAFLGGGANLANTGGQGSTSQSEQTDGNLKHFGLVVGFVLFGRMCVMLSLAITDD